MLDLMRAHYEGVDAAGFEADLNEKDRAVVLRRSGSIVGFSTLTELECNVRSIPVTAFFSGDTIVDASVRGDAALARTWGRAVFDDAARIRRVAPDRRVYWLLISAGYKTYRFLPLFFRRYQPAAGHSPDAFEDAVRHALARSRYGERYDPATGIVRLEHPTPLRSGVADVADRPSDPHVATFVRLNPCHTEGDELVCLTALDHANLTRGGRRVLGLGPAPGDPVALHAGDAKGSSGA
ncbi:MAG: hypothetical protein EA416_07795 [Trueperaceae bacterium]|nr:MAG: hypothetical protein EA416_07795 [Trueperaceae bacterium]